VCLRIFARSPAIFSRQGWWLGAWSAICRINFSSMQSFHPCFELSHCSQWFWCSLGIQLWRSVGMPKHSEVWALLSSMHPVVEHRSLLGRCFGLLLLWQRLSRMQKKHQRQLSTLLVYQTWSPERLQVVQNIWLCIRKGAKKSGTFFARHLLQRWKEFGLQLLNLNVFEKIDD